MKGKLEQVAEMQPSLYQTTFSLLAGPFSSQRLEFILCHAVIDMLTMFSPLHVKCCLVASYVFNCRFSVFLFSCVLANTTRIFEGTRIVKTGMVRRMEVIPLSFPVLSSREQCLNYHCPSQFGHRIT